MALESDALVQVRLREGIGQFPLLNRHLASSLLRRAQQETWYENSLIRGILQEQWDWFKALEGIFARAQLDDIRNSGEIFGPFQGTEADYDGQLFDALAEVEFACWARDQGCNEIEKLERASHQTPDFRISTTGQVLLGEASRFRSGDYLIYFVTDLLQWLALVTGCFHNFGVVIEPTPLYDQVRDDVLASRSKWVQKARSALSECLVGAVEQHLRDNHGSAIKVVGGLFQVRRNAGNGVTCEFPVSGRLEVVLSKLEGQLIRKLRQINTFMREKQLPADRAVVFFSGVDEWEGPWWRLWLELKDAGSSLWRSIAAAKTAADKVIDVPFDLVVGRCDQLSPLGGSARFGPVRYAPMPWTPSEY